MINAITAKALILKNFNNDFAGMLVSQETENEFVSLVLNHAFEGRQAVTTKEKLALAYRTVKNEFFGVNS